MNNQIHNTRSAQSFLFLSPCRTNTSTVYIQVPKFYKSLNEWMGGWREGERDERTNKRLNEGMNLSSLAFSKPLQIGIKWKKWLAMPLILHMLN